MVKKSERVGNEPKERKDVESEREEGECGMSREWEMVEEGEKVRNGQEERQGRKWSRRVKGGKWLEGE